MDAGRLRDRITIRRRVDAKNSRGEIDRSWTTIVQDLSAEVRSINSRESLSAGVLQGSSYFEITVRYRTDLKASDQVLWGSRELNIIGPAEDREGRRQWTIIQASTQTAQGV